MAKYVLSKIPLFGYIAVYGAFIVRYLNALPSWRNHDRSQASLFRHVAETFFIPTYWTYQLLFPYTQLTYSNFKILQYECASCKLPRALKDFQSRTHAKFFWQPLIKLIFFLPSRTQKRDFRHCGEGMSNPLTNTTVAKMIDNIDYSIA